MIKKFNDLSASSRAVMLMTIALFMFTLMGICIKLAAQTIPVIEVVFFRNALAFILLVPLITYHGWGSIRMNQPKLFFLRAFVNAGGMFLGFTALALIPLAEVTALSFTTPLFITVGAVVFFGEVIRARRIVAIGIGLIGALIILRPGIIPISAGSLMALGGALSIAMASLIVKKQTQTESPESIVTWMVAMQAPIVLIPALQVWEWPDLVCWTYLWGLALSGTIAHLCFTRAYRLVDITALQPLEFMKLPFAVILAWLIFQEWPNIWTWVGGTVIFVSTAYIVQRERLAKQSIRPSAGLHETKL